MLALVAAGVAGCGGDEGERGGSDAAAADTAERPGARAGAPPASEAVPALGRDVTFPTSDGISISASFAAPEAERRAPALVLLHQLGSDRTDWAGFAPELRREGYATLALDLRGMGRSLSRFPSKERYAPPPDQRRYLRDMRRDVAAGDRFLRRRDDVDRERVVLVGLGAGANLAWRSSGASGVRGAVALGPALPADELPPPPEAAGDPRGVLFVAPRLQAALSHELAGDTGRPRRVSLSLGDAAGAALLANERVKDEVLTWLRRIAG